MRFSMIQLTDDSSDLETTSAVVVAQTGLQSMNSAIQDILAAIFANQTAPTNSHDQVSQGLDAANSVLSTIKE